MTIDTRLIAIIDELLAGGILLEQAMTEFELKFVRRAIERSRGNITDASKKVGVHRNTLMAKIPRNTRRDVRNAARQAARLRRRKGRG